jgi:biopolymer transport protein TolR
MEHGNQTPSGRRRQVVPTIQITPFVDVVLVLLVIFMITTPLIISGVDISLPDGKEDVSYFSKYEPLTVTLTKEEKIFIDEQQIMATALIETVTNKTGGDKNRPIFVRSDIYVKYGTVLALINLLNSSGYKKTVLVTQST